MDKEGERVLKRTRAQRTRTEPEPDIEEEAKEDALCRENQMPRLMQQERFREADSNVGSSSSSSTSGSCWQGNINKKFDVFISHRGPDTKQTLAWHLYDLLRYRGFEVFLDREELEAGEIFSGAIKEAIQCSRVHLCILWSGYTESVRCLKELEMMMHRYEIGASVIIPIFYDVEPSDVRHLKGVIGQGMEKHTQMYSSEVVEKWRDALRKIANIKGYEGKGSIAMEVTAHIWQLLDVGSPANSNKVVVGIWNQLKSVQDDITRSRKEGHDRTSVEISGIGGIGKTTFAKILYKNIRSGYTRTCFIADVNGLVEKGGVNAVHKQIISDLFGYDPNPWGSSGKQFLKSRLKNEKILIVLDNINKENCVSAFFMEDDVSLRATSTIIVTSREQGVLQYDPDISRYRKNLLALRISKLPFVVSKELFRRYALEGSRCRVDPQQDCLMNRIIWKCDGIPLALELFGKHVYGKDLEFWKTFWASIEHSLPPDITKILRFTYDHLDTDLEKCLFLDVAIFFRRERVDFLRKIRGKPDEDDGKVSVALINLERKHLIDTSNDRLDMHDLLVDLGRTIVMEESSCPGCRSRVWHPSDVRKLLSEERGTDTVKGLSLVWGGSSVLDEDENGNPCAWSADVFGGMPSMEILILQGNCIEGDFSKLSKKLLWLRWTNFPFETIPMILCIKHIRILHLTGQNMTHLWEHSSKEAPANLRKLNVHNCTKLQRLPEFSRRFKQLSSIVLDGCESLEHIPDSFGQLQGLKHLKLGSCVALQLLPESIGDLNSLIELEIDDCSKLKLLPMSLGKLGQLQKLLLLKCNALEQLPQTFGDLIKLQLLEASGCSELKSLPPSFSRLPQISDILIDHCQNLAIDEDRFEQITSLRDLQLFDCKVPKLPWQVGQQNHLRTLSVCNTSGSTWSHHNVPSLASFSETEVEELSLNTENLKDLELLDLENISFTHLPVSMENLTALQKLRLCHCFNLRELPESVAKLSRLTILQLEDCPRLRQLPSCTGNLSHLTELSITGCCDLTELPESIGRLSSLKVLALDGCSSLQEVPLAIGNLSRLTNLSMNGCCYLKELPKSIDGLSSLVFLALNDCWSLREVPSGIGNLSRLTMLSMNSCRDLGELPESIGRLSSLSSLALYDCLSLQKVPFNIGNLSQLTYLYLTNCHDLRVLPESIGRLSSLDILFLHNCWNLQELPAAIEKLSNLRVLSVYKCRNLQVLPMLKGRCPNFQDLPYTVDNSRRKFAVTVFPDCYACTKGSPQGKANFITLTRPKELPNLERLFVSGCMKNQKHMMRHSCYKPPIPDDIIHQFHKLNRLSLSPSHGHGIDYNYENLEDLDPGIFLTEKEDQCWFHFIGRTYSSSSISGHIIPNPKYSYTLSQSEKADCFRLSQGKTMLMCVQVEDFQEKVMVRKLHLTDKQSMAERGSIDDDEEFAGYTAVVQEGGVISLTPGNITHEFFLREQKKHPLYSGFHIDIPTSPLLRIWKQIPIHIWGLSALDIANCNITNKYSHCSTCLMEEETGLSWKRRMRLFYDDHALELLRKDSKFRHVAVSVSGSDLQTVADVCETCVSVVSYDQMGKSKVVQTYVINWTLQVVPSYFYCDFASTSSQVQWKIYDSRWNHWPRAFRWSHSPRAFRRLL